MLCDICKMAFEKSFINLGPPGSGSHGLRHNEHLIYTLEDSALNSCVVCKFFWENVVMPKADIWFGDAPRHCQLTYHASYHSFWDCGHNPIEGTCRVTLGIGPERDILRFDALRHFVQYPVQNDSPIPRIETRCTSTADAENLWRYWFRTCSESHKSCRGEESGPQSFLPSRLVRISKSNGALYWRLVCNFDIKVTKYMTLSHCWGESQHTKLTRDNISCFKEKQLVSNLPKTYRDAMTVALSLKVQHIWIDSLCIIQDDNDDWKSQSSSMGLIYQNACCNIAATWGVDGTAGCFSERDGSSKSIKVIVNGDSGLKEHVVYDKFAYKSEITDASLNKRGWVTQERNLARKQLSFAKSQVYWECSELSASEDFPEGIPRGMEDLRQKKLMSTRWIGLDHIEEYEFRHTWIHLVESYSECKLKKLSDESAALAGVAGYMKTATNNTYLAGLWKKDLEQQLLWRRKSSQSCPSESPSYIAPTWSWMCLDAPVQYDRGYTLKNTTYESRYKPIPYSAEILEVSVEPFDAMHSFRSAEVKLRGIAIRAAVISTEPSEESGSCVTWRTLQLADEIGITQGIHIGVGISWDRSAVSEQNLLFMFVSTGQIKCYAGDMNGLVLKGSNENELVYHRLGVFSTAVPYIYLKGREIDLSHIIRERLAVKNSRANDNGSTSVAQEYLNLDDERLKGLVHTVTII